MTINRSDINAYIAHGWKLVPVQPGNKGPRIMGWNSPHAALKRAEDLPEWAPPYGVGLMHAYSGTMALDIDDWGLARLFGLDVDALYAAPDAVTILSGREGRGKLLYRMPEGVILPHKQFIVDKKVVFEFRCATTEGKTVQDLLPPTIHPDTQQPYQWGGAGHWSRLPLIPDHLLTMWKGMIVDVRPPSADGVDSSWEEIEGALGHISPDCSRQEWIEVGMALHWAGEHTFNPERAFHLWDTWSQPSSKYPGQRTMLSQWASFKTTKATSITLGTLFHHARQAGWVRPVPDASTLFSAVVPARPVDIMSLLRPAPPPVPLDVWPDLLARRAQEVSEGVGCDPLVPLWAGLGAVCGAVDARSRLELMPGFKVPPVLWLMTLGRPADKKTPGSTPMLAPLDVIEAEDRKRYALDLGEYEVANAAYTSAHKARMEAAGDPKYGLDSQLPDVPPEPVKPVPVRIRIQDATSQKIVHLAAERPRGMLCHLDEMNGWVNKMVNRNSGEDRSTWVVSYEASRYDMDRVNRGTIAADNFAISIYGNIQPRVLEQNFKDLTADGLMQRFLPAVLRSDQTRLGNPKPEFLTSADEWLMMLKQVYLMGPQTYVLSHEAHQVFRAFQEWYEDRKRIEYLANASDTYMTAFGKLEGLVGRLALVFHLIENHNAREVSADIVERVIVLIKRYVIPVYRHLYDNDDRSAAVFDQWVMDHVIHHADKERLTLIDIRTAARRPFERADIKQLIERNQWVINAMALLEDREWVHRIDDRTQEHRGGAEWLINPNLKTLFADYRKAVIKAKVERTEEIQTYGRYKAGFVRINGSEILEE